jgi:formylglycine-generating enzyme required for sulfatase activity
MILVEGGTYMMGLAKITRPDGSEQISKTPRTHQVTLRSFKIAKYEVTQAQWQSVMGDSMNLSYNQGCAKCPVEEVSWNDTQLFIRRLNALTGKQYRLPTEAEWEFASRGGTKTKNYKYSGSDFLDQVILPQGTFTGKTQPVGGRRPNELGTYDMTGNVSEWCSDWFNPDYLPGAVTDPPGAASGYGYVIRGSHWGQNSGQSQAGGDFINGYPNDRNAHLGFRLAMSL